MEYIRGMTFAPFAGRNTLLGEEPLLSMKIMKERLGTNTVILVPGGVQQTPQSTVIDYTSEHTMSDKELKCMIHHAQEMGLRVFLKPTVNCLNGTWRAHINFFDEDVPCEPKWFEWFSSYADFQLHYATIAEENGCEMFIVGCEMVMAERRETEWRKLIEEIRGEYHGLISYNTDKYQENNVKWWDCVDVISSSGYYPADDWENQLNRIEKVVDRYKKPFFFAESGCMSTTGSSERPNDWKLEGSINLQEQKLWYEKAVHAMKKKSWVQGVAFWSWDARLYSPDEAENHKYYQIYEKPAEQVIHWFFSDRSEKL
ncbi:hypothetical protein GCM10023142_17950 [Anaerocolumna aminovalerica]|uniref:1,4-beta-xylanase n=1 Tax=Anaerocolumna aminovalerica TaxID=1527 RepID=A0A1I5FZ65_9FIRM|nr:1,4-beta-xylanase [Anaerocolumna aminovalerica]SFO29064.1 hypothetical protein SAMN04489757_11688 [Anaerocolumna aminovalerica]